LGEPRLAGVTQLGQEASAKRLHALARQLSLVLLGLELRGLLLGSVALALGGLLGRLGLLHLGGQIAVLALKLLDLGPSLVALLTQRRQLRVFDLNQCHFRCAPWCRSIRAVRVRPVVKLSDLVLEVVQVRLCVGAHSATTPEYQSGAGEANIT